MNKLILCLTNTVAADLTANVLLSIGAKPAMIENPEEAAELAASAGAVLVNVGTLTEAQTEVMLAAVRVCREHGVPWVLDPVACHLLAYRRGFLRQLLSVAKPTLVRGNHAEIDFLRMNLASELAGVTMLSTGEIDRIYSDASTVEIVGGVEMLQAVTATGCAQGAVAAALLAEGMSPPAAAESASRLMKRAGEIATNVASAPGSFRGALVDALYRLHGDLTR